MAYIDTNVNCWKKLSLSVVRVSKKLRRLFRMGYYEIAKVAVIHCGLSRNREGRRPGGLSLCQGVFVSKEIEGLAERRGESLILQSSRTHKRSHQIPEADQAKVNERAWREGPK